jgi:hypothetical protein
MVYLQRNPGKHHRFDELDSAENDGTAATSMPQSMPGMNH